MKQKTKTPKGRFFDMVYVMLAEGFEEVEALAPVDMLRRAGVNVVTVGVTGEAVRGSHGVVVAADITAEQMDMTDAQMVVLPGGMPGYPSNARILIRVFRTLQIRQKEPPALPSGHREEAKRFSL